MDSKIEAPSGPLVSRRVAAWWILAIALALVLDGPVAHLCAPIAQAIKHSEVAEELKEGGNFIFVLILGVFIWILHPLRLRGALLLAAGGIISGLISSVMKWTVGRMRPVTGINPFDFEPFARGLHGLFSGHNLTFPSGHSTLAFATAACLGYLLPRGRWAFYVAAGLTAAERVGELAHYLSDVLVGAAVGIISFHLALRLFCLIEARLALPRTSPAMQ